MQKHKTNLTTQVASDIIISWGLIYFGLVLGVWYFSEIAYVWFTLIILISTMGGLFMTGIRLSKRPQHLRALSKEASIAHPLVGYGAISMLLKVLVIYFYVSEVFAIILLVSFTFFTISILKLQETVDEYRKLKNIDK